MNVFETAKQSVTARQAAEAYGIKVKRNGMACCPFHQDKTPSMKMDERYYCFGCGATGDVIDFTARCFGLTNLEAARKLAEDFNIPHEEWNRSDASDKKRKSKQQRQEERKKQQQRERAQKVLRIQKEFDSWISQTVELLILYRKTMLVWEKLFAPENSEEEWHPLFLEALNKKNVVDAMLDILMFGGKEEQIDFFLHSREEVEKIERRMERYQRNILAEAGIDYGAGANDGGAGTDDLGYFREGKDAAEQAELCNGIGEGSNSCGSCEIQYPDRKD